MSERFICIGDSITEGIGDQLGIGWPGRLSDYLSNKYPETWHINNLGLAGNTSKDILYRMHTEVRPRTPYRLLISAGINDTIHHAWPTSSGTRLSIQYSRDTWSQIADNIHQMSIPTAIIGITPVNEERLPLIYKPRDAQDGGIYTTNDSLISYEDMLSSVAQEFGIPFIPLHQRLLEEGYTKHLDDGIHPSKAGYDMIASPLISELEKIKFFTMA